jgi:hypothetical protein
MRNINYFLDDAQNSRQGQFELDFADVITCFDTFSTRLVTEDGRTLIMHWNGWGMFQDYEVVQETPLMKGHPGMAEEIVTMLKHMNVDGETMQYIIKSVGMEEQMLRQLMMTQPINDVEYNWEVRRNQ